MDVPNDNLRADEACDDPATEMLVRDMLVRIADRWTLLVIDILEKGEHRFSQLRDQLPGISQKMLTQTLRQLERDGLVARHVHPVVPPRVDYRLTALGESLYQTLCGLWIWAGRHRLDVEAARRAFDGQGHPETPPRPPSAVA